jgi:diguanylate cyclase (GGDEF)-like protein
MTQVSDGFINLTFESLLERFDLTIYVHPSQAFTLAQSALEMAETEHQRAKALVRLGWAERVLLHLQDAEAHNDEALGIFERLGDLENHTLGLILISAVDVYTGHRERSYTHAMQALEQARTIGHQLYEARACNALGALFDWYSNPSLALEYLLQSLQLLRELNQPILENMVLSNIGAIHYRQAEYEKALEYYHISLKGLQSVQGGSMALMSKVNIAESLIKVGQADQAEDILESVLSEIRAYQHTTMESFTIRTLGTAQLAQRKLQIALETYQKAVDFTEKQEMIEDRGLAWLGLGQTWLALKEVPKALVELSKAQNALIESSAENQLETLKAMVEAHEMMGDYRQALEIQRQFSELERQYRETNSQRYVQSLMLRFDMAEQQRQTLAALQRNQDLEIVIQEKERLAAELERLSFQDPLTGVYNRRYLDQHFAELLEVSDLQNRTVCVAMLDLDHFKHINDQFSHLIGDQVLRQTAQLILGNVRKSDVVARFGGEEFVIILLNTNLEAAYLLCERLRKSIEEFVWQRLDTQLKVTISAGLAAAKPSETVEQLLTRADQLLYRAKQNGRNQIILAT